MNGVPVPQVQEGDAALLVRGLVLLVVFVLGVATGVQLSAWVQ